jgi:glycosyltransferase involved in cell wall biosynthesis
MRVAMEAASLGLSSGGLARYTSELSLALARCFPQDEFLLLSDQPFSMPPGAPENLKRGGGPQTAAERRWWLWGLSREARRRHADVVHGPDFAVPYLPQLPSVVTLHDLSPWMESGWHHAAQRVRRRSRLLLNLGIPTMIVTPTELVRKQALQRFRIPSDRIVAVPPAAPSWMQPIATRPDRPYFLYVGTLEPRKNLPMLVEAWREIRQHFEIDLVLAGRRRADGPQFAEEPGLCLLGEVTDQQLPQLYSGALAFVYPSLYEGFGLPVLEAMQCGTCVITSAACREAGGDAALYADTPPQLVEAMRKVASDTQFAAAQRAKSLAHAREYSWERSARLTYAVYEEARRRFGR